MRACVRACMHTCWWGWVGGGYHFCLTYLACIRSSECFLQYLITNYPYPSLRLWFKGGLSRKSMGKDGGWAGVGGGGGEVSVLFHLLKFCIQ